MKFSKWKVNLIIENDWHSLLIYNIYKDIYNLLEYNIKSSDYVSTLNTFNEHVIKLDEKDMYYLVSIVGYDKKINKEDVIYFPENKINTCQEPKYLMFSSSAI